MRKNEPRHFGGLIIQDRWHWIDNLDFDGDPKDRMLSGQDTGISKYRIKDIKLYGKPVLKNLRFYVTGKHIG